jgi:hypothetical protein
MSRIDGELGVALTFNLASQSRVRIACGDLLPAFPFVDQVQSPICTSGAGGKRFGMPQRFSQKKESASPLRDDAPLI